MFITLTVQTFRVALITMGTQLHCHHHHHHPHPADDFRGDEEEEEEERGQVGK